MATRATENPESNRSKVFLVDDHPIVRQGLTLLINQQSDLEVCGQAEEAQSVLQAIALYAPDILILDISLKGRDGIDLLKDLRARDANLPVLILSMHDEVIYAERALRAGANGYITKQEATENVLMAIRRVLRREVYVSDSIAGRMLQQFLRGSSATAQSPLGSLSDRELEVFRLVGKGHGARQIANELNLSVKTVESYQAHIKQKLALRNARELVQYAVEWSVSEKA